MRTLGVWAPVWTAMATASVALGCAGAAPLPMVRTRAERDLDCPDRDIRVEEQVGGRYKAIGCGRKARYYAACDLLRCVVRSEDEPVIPWRDRPEPSPGGP